MAFDNVAVLLRAREQELSAIYENVPGIVFYIAVESDQQFRFVSVSRDFLATTGLAREQVVGSLVGDIIPPPSCDVVLSHYREAIRSGQPVRWEEESVYPAGRRYGEVAVTPLYDANGVPTRLIGIVHDITDRKRMEQDHAEADRRKDEFLSLLGHELRNPLAAISTAVQLLSGSVSEEERVSLNEMMDRQVKLMQRLLDDLLDLSRITHGHIQLKKLQIDLAQFLQHVTGGIQSTMAERGQELMLRLPAEVVTFMADEVRLEQIAGNLLSNASKYTDRGGRIEFSGTREGSEVVLRCSDNGRGIPQEMLEKIFQPFVRVEPLSDSRGEASLGIGLALVKHLVELHGGTIAVESRGPGMGSQFSVRLPLEAGSPAPSSDPETQHALTLPCSRSIVLIEDNPDVAQPLMLALEHAGYQVTLFTDAFSAIAGLSDLKPDAVLLDIGLPGMDGYELAAQLRRSQNLSNRLFVAISGFRKRQTRDASDDFDYYFTKPVDVGSLLNVLDEALAEEKGALQALLIDDHVPLATAMAKLLNREGLEVRTAFSGEEGLRCASALRPQLILCDLNLPDMGGHEVVRRLRSNPATRHAYSVILTALSEAEVRSFNDEAKDIGVDEFIRKPVMPEVLHSLVAKLRR